MHEPKHPTKEGPIFLRPLTDRDMFIVQDYVRVVGVDDGDGSGRWFFTYNHDVEHLYFTKRPGFVRVKMKYQGMVGVSADGGKTRLTWLLNMDFGGLVPSSFTACLFVNMMLYPLTTVDDAKKLKDQKKDPSSSSLELDNDSEVSRNLFEEMQKKLELLQDELEVSLGKTKEAEVEKEALRDRVKALEGKVKTQEVELSVLRLRMKRGAGDREEEKG